ncbi:MULTISPECIES: tRNA (N6-threonylcarbamoyladenosine(37)-N6)-methyltransferase TrmO [unclassified Paludibacterium]|uniref:tRNA (N6-threonylcarbamoyladenosine(37)-N6)-methyltransferase TrmO n=1 Tax=unclassified Paludibacterium TaxID=2618429 RepID=UPI00207B7F66|nr:tRNA (N6-threonylcarbamoyladenosine(37)-N6)-methyltransferase TrmO [Paludibacterium sp. B53371]BEV73030.1 tRNA (N6-threonylcarbamoyladenosine(37)-N6)-methyltransferase TrmO [Paludibacterium sp. THUN1379]
MKDLTPALFYNAAMHYSFEPIGLIRAPYKEKFGIPRQSSLAPSARSELVLLPPYDHPDCVRGLHAFSHLWLQFVFHETAARGWTPLIRPPRLGGNARVGVFASRSTHRPNPIGLSLVELAGIECDQGVRLQLRGADLLDGTPILDIKPYIPFVESRPDARSGFVDGPPPQLPVSWHEQALADLASHSDLPADFRQLVNEVLAQDPRPAYQDDPMRVYGVRLCQVDVRFRVALGQVEVLEIQALTQN